MNVRIVARLTLDYGEATTPELLRNLSGIAHDGDRLWTVGDEARTVECLARTDGGFRLAQKYVLDDIIAAIPGFDSRDELDIESVDFADGRLWLCGSHCRVRRKPEADDMVNAELRSRPSRCILAAVKLKPDGIWPGAAKALPFKGDRSLRAHLAANPYLRPFLELPSKENGLDIEGLVIRTGKALLGLRGPLVDSVAITVALELDRDFQIAGSKLHFLDLEGLGVRDLARDGDDVFVLAGPVSAAQGPFKLYRWTPRTTGKIQKPTDLFTWPASAEKPEGLCLYQHDGRGGLLVVYDSPDPAARIDDTRYAADWLALD
jgi:hypothetical protein